VNYVRIYDEFIKNRRDREAAATGYTEKHHIVPRCMGGGNEAGNIVRLTPEDHYFAHLLLAKAHGGRNWASLKAMVGLAKRSTDRDLTKLRARFQFGHVRRGLAEYYRSRMAGPNGRVADKTQYTLHNFDGRVVTGVRMELPAKTGLAKNTIHSLVRGVDKSAHGWYDPRHNPKGMSKGERQTIERSNQWTLYHYDGRVWSGTNREFCAAFGIKIWFQHPNGCVKGWYRTAKQARDHEKFRAESHKRAGESRRRNASDNSK